MENVVVIFGGKTCEHDISIISSVQMMSNIKDKNVIPIYIAKDTHWYTGKELLDIHFYKKRDLSKLKQVSILPNDNFLYSHKNGKLKRMTKIDFAFVVMHGLNGEDGTVQGLLELADIPYSSSGVLSCAVGMDKEIMKKVLKANNLPIVDYLAFNNIEYTQNVDDVLEQILNGLEPSYIVKPANLGSSIGISCCKTREELTDALELAFSYDDKVVVEKKVENLLEVNISVMGDDKNIEVSQTEEPLSWKEFLTFDEKYLSKSGKTGSKNSMSNMKRIIPAKLKEKEIAEIETLAKKTFKALNCFGLIRIDFLYDKDDKKIFINEINTIPGSNAFYLWDKTYSYAQLIDKMEDIGKRKFEIKQSKIYTHNSNVIK